ncbi:MAG TPA: trypsin-like peptidase domain-containing protein [Candidatus Sulfomarinibacteraceae bacterium]|nr:trypsin-like peptidase domain-containing protein [Candidatus Sulfomarinibacteraceae bacterium]
MNDRRVAVAGGGCALIGIFVATMACVLLLLPLGLITSVRSEVFPERQQAATVAPDALETQAAVEALPATTQEPIPTIAARDQGEALAAPSIFPQNARQAEQESVLTELYNELNPGVVNIQIFIDRGFGGQGAGSGFILDEQGHIVTNNHVVAGASGISVVFYEGTEVEATVVGRDEDSDLAVIRVEEMPDSVHPLPLADSSAVQTGQWVLAIGNPFSLGGSMSLGIVSAVGRVIPSGVTPFSIPEAIQTDAAINPGNSGGPLLNLAGEVIGVNAQIRTQAGVAANAGVGFAIPSNVVRRVAPVLIEQGTYSWPWLGVRGDSVNLSLMRELNLESQRGAYIVEAVPGGPAAGAGIRGDDVIVEVNGEPVESYDQLLTMVAFSNPGDTLELTIVRNGQREQVSVTLAPRPENFER